MTGDWSLSCPPQIRYVLLGRVATEGAKAEGGEMVVFKGGSMSEPRDSA